MDGPNAAEYKHFVTESVLPLVEKEINKHFFTNNLTDYKPVGIKAEFVNSPDEILSRYLANTSLFWAGVNLTFSPGSAEDQPVANAQDAAYTILMKEHGIDYQSPFVPDPERFGDASIPGIANDSFTESQCRNANYTGPGNSSLIAFFEQQCDTGLYWSSGFLALQSALDAALCGIDTAHRPFMQMQEAPRSEYVLERSGPLQPIAVMMIIMGFAPWVQFLMVHIVGEKEKGIKEAMYLMGMKVDMYWLSWFLTYTVMSVVPCIAMTVVTKVMGLFSNANAILVFLILFAFSLSIISLGLLLSNFFKQAKTAGLVGMLSMTVVSLSIFGIKNITSGAVKGLCSLVSPLAACFALQTTLAIDATEGLHWDQFVHGGSGFSPLAATLMLFFDAGLYFLLTILIDTSFFGWFSSNAAASADAAADTSSHATAICEQVSPELAAKKALSVINVAKSFGSGTKTKRALKGVSFDLYEGQIFALLGHNGAGKSTMHTIISGHIQPTSGTVSIYGHDVQTAAGRNSVREIMGVCPQHDILFDKLTVQEHMALFGAIKGVPPAKLTVAMEEGMKEVHLHTQRGVQSERLSGGQKRKLSVALALIGDPKVICLDEPTSGMDPLSRRQLWDLLQAKRPGRVMLFTTHQMDEADILADRKAVLSHGKLQCLGSSLFLKTRFGLGYHLNVVKRREAPQAALSGVVQQHFPETQIACHEVGIAQGGTSECVYELPLSGLKQFSGLFGALDASASTLGIASYGVSMTTLDEVFLRLADEDDGASNDAADNAADPDVELLDMSASSGDGDGDGDDDLLLEAGSVNGTAAPPARASVQPRWQVQLWALMAVRAKQMLRTPMALNFQIVAPCILLVIGLVVVMKPTAVDQWSNETIRLTPGVASPVSSMPFIVDNDAVTPDYLETLGENFEYVGMNMTDVSEANVSWTLEEYYIAQQGSRTALMYPAAVTFDKILNVPLTTVMYDPASVHALPSYISALNDASCKMYPSGSREKNITSVSASSRPLPVNSAPGFDTGTFNTVLFVGMAISVIPGGFAVDLVRDRKLKNKHQLFTSGTPLSIYFTAYFLMNVMMMLIPVTVGIILMLGMNVTALIGPALPVTILFMFTYTPLTILASFVGSYLFTEPDTCQSQLPPAINLAGFMPYICVGVIDAAGHSDTAVALHYILCVFDPPYTLLGAMYFIFRVELANQGQITSKVLTTADYFASGTHLTATLLIMLAQCGMFAGMLWMIEFGWQRCCPARAPPGAAAAEHEDEDDEDDDDVVKAGELASGPQGRQALIRLTGLTKSFAAKGPAGSARKEIKRAVRGLSFGVNAGEVLGLLGPNGAGKTTTISILTGEQQASTGEAFIGGHSIQTDLADAFRELGFCPQFSALFPRITVWEHLVLYARLHGFAGAAAEARALQYMRKMGIQSFRNVRCADLSGGTQRKVSIAIALLGDPRAVLLDEPSSGIDPATRRFLWDVVREHTEGRATVLTTHSMEEADALCTKIAIMTSGKMRCIGSPQHLKNKFSTGYTLELKSIHSNADAINQFVQQRFPGAVVLEEYDGFFKYRVEDVPPLAVVFKTLEDARGPLSIEEYSFSQPSLEQIFLDFAKKQQAQPK